MPPEIPDPLLRLPDATIAVPSELDRDDALDAVFIQALDHVNLHAMAWPAADPQGVLLPPPGEHVLHELAHAYNLADEEDLLVNPRLGTVGVLAELPTCDICRAPARYDAVITVGEGRGGAYLCADQYREKGSGTLGASGDAYLLLHSEVSSSVQSKCNEIRLAQGKDPLF